MKGWRLKHDYPYIELQKRRYWLGVFPYWATVSFVDDIADACRIIKEYVAAGFE